MFLLNQLVIDNKIVFFSVLICFCWHYTATVHLAGEAKKSKPHCPHKRAIVNSLFLQKAVKSKAENERLIKVNVYGGADQYVTNEISATTDR